MDGTTSGFTSLSCPTGQTKPLKYLLISYYVTYDEKLRIAYVSRECLSVSHILTVIIDYLGLELGKSVIVIQLREDDDEAGSISCFASDFYS